jgi:hypothetical protein
MPLIVRSSLPAIAHKSSSQGLRERAVYVASVSNGRRPCSGDVMFDWNGNGDPEQRGIQWIRMS